MKIDGFELRRLAMPLVAPFQTSFGTQHAREVIVLRLVTSVGDGWGECVTLSEPVYSTEFNDAAAIVLRDHLIPALAAQRHITAARVRTILAPIKGHRMAKAAIEMAVLDAELRAAGMSLADYLGAVTHRVPAGVSVGIQASIDDLLETVGRFVDQGYARIKLKIQPGWDIEPVRAVRDHFGWDLPLQVDANTAYRLVDTTHLMRLDPFNLLLIEQPLDEDDLTEHAELAKRLKTPICLDESVVSAKAAADAIRLGACSIVNIKPGRVGGYLEARRVHDVCGALGVSVWCGGMLETGLGRAANIALAALPGFVLPGDTSASDRFYREDITEPFVLDDGHVTVPTGPGLGVDVIPAALDEVTINSEWIGAT